VRFGGFTLSVSVAERSILSADDHFRPTPATRLVKAQYRPPGTTAVVRLTSILSCRGLRQLNRTRRGSIDFVTNRLAMKSIYLANVSRRMNICRTTHILRSTQLSETAGGISGDSSETRGIAVDEDEGKLRPASAAPYGKEKRLRRLLHLPEHGTGRDVSHQRAEVPCTGPQPPHPGTPDEPLHPRSVTLQ
jgi:hypothetical protein